MFFDNCKPRLLCGIWLCLLAACSQAATGSADWGRWFEQQLSQHPDLIAASASRQAAMATADSRDRPLYNPALESAWEREGDADNYQLGLSQTIDWSDKRGLRQQQAVADRLSAAQHFQLLEQQKKAQALAALVRWQAATQQAALARTQQQQRQLLLSSLEERQQSGDLARLDIELAYLSLAQTLASSADIMAQQQLRHSQLDELLPGWSAQQQPVPARFWPRQLPPHSDRQLEQHPAVAAARAEWQALQHAASLARRQQKADPSVAVSAGKSNDEDIIALRFSIPLHVRNRFSAESRAAGQEALAAEAHYRAVRRKQQYAQDAARAVLREYQQRFTRWQALRQGRQGAIETLLEQQWRSGDLSTAQYLLTAQQHREGLAAGIELRQQFQLAYIDWLLASGQINHALSSLTANTDLQP